MKPRRRDSSGQSRSPACWRRSRHSHCSADRRRPRRGKTVAALTGIAVVIVIVLAHPLWREVYHELYSADQFVGRWKLVDHESNGALRGRFLDLWDEMADDVTIEFGPEGEGMLSGRTMVFDSARRFRVVRTAGGSFQPNTGMEELFTFHREVDDSVIHIAAAEHGDVRDSYRYKFVGRNLLILKDSQWGTTFRLRRLSR